MKNNALLSSLRGLRLAVHLLLGLVLALIAVLTRDALPRDRLAHWWLSVLLDVFNVQVRVHGAPARGAQILVANHVSWLDIPVIAAQGEVRFVAKSGIRHWPIVGCLTTAAGTYYIRRGGNLTAALRARMLPYLEAGGRLLFFPEGTTSDGRRVGRFHARLFALAAETGRTIQPVALRYGCGADGSQVAPYVGDDALFWHVLRLLREPALTVELDYCAPIAAQGQERKQLAALAQGEIERIVAPDAALATAPRGEQPAGDGLSAGGVTMARHSPPSLH